MSSACCAPSTKRGRKMSLGKSDCEDYDDGTDKNGKDSDAKDVNDRTDEYGNFSNGEDEDDLTDDDGKDSEGEDGGDNTDEHGNDSNGEDCDNGTDEDGVDSDGEDGSDEDGKYSDGDDGTDENGKDKGGEDVTDEDGKDSDGDDSKYRDYNTDEHGKESDGEDEGEILHPLAEVEPDEKIAANRRTLLAQRGSLHPTMPKLVKNRHICRHFRRIQACVLPLKSKMIGGRASYKDGRRKAEFPTRTVIATDFSSVGAPIRYAALGNANVHK